MRKYEIETEDGVYEVETSSFRDWEAPPRVRAELTDEIRQMILSEISAALKSKIAAIVAEIRPERVLETRTIEREGPKVEKLVIREIDQKALEKAISDRLAAFRKDYEKNWKNIAPIVVPNGIANMEGQSGKVLSTDGRLTKWITSVAGGGNVSTDVYTVSSGTTTRSFSATNTSIDELANVLASLIASLQGAGIIQ